MGSKQAPYQSGPNNSCRHWTNNHNNNANIHNICIVVPYNKGLSKSFKKICDKFVSHAHFRGGNTISSLIVSHKDKNTIIQKSGVICRFKCTQIGCKEKYTRESGRTSGDKLKQHLRLPSHSSVNLCPVVYLKAYLLHTEPFRGKLDGSGLCFLFLGNNR